MRLSQDFSTAFCQNSSRRVVNDFTDTADAYDRFAGELAQAGVLRGGSALDEAQRSTVRGAGGADRAVRGARLGGYFVIAAPDLATAERWARKAPLWICRTSAKTLRRPSAVSINSRGGGRTPSAALGESSAVIAKCPTMFGKVSKKILDQKSPGSALEGQYANPGGASVRRRRGVRF
jgi:hypothetical protein